MVLQIMYISSATITNQRIDFDVYISIYNKWALWAKTYKKNINLINDNK